MQIINELFPLTSEYLHIYGASKKKAGLGLKVVFFTRGRGGRWANLISCPYILKEELIHINNFIQFLNELMPTSSYTC